MELIVFLTNRRENKSMSKQEVRAVIKLHLMAGNANPAPPLGPALGQHGVNIMLFCKEFNSRTRDQVGAILGVVITIYKDRTFSFVVKTPPTSDLLKKAAGIATASREPNKIKVGSITESQLAEIARVKLSDLNTKNLEAAKNMIRGTARSMGIDIVPDRRSMWTGSMWTSLR